MPFMGLLDKHGKELKGDGYHRIDSSGITFKISPSNEPNVHWVFVNTSAVIWPTATGPWPNVHSVCVYNEIDDELPIVITPLHASGFGKGDLLVMAPGQLTMTMRINPPGKPGRARCSECGKLLTE